MSKKIYFTLLELLIAIAVIGILVTLLLPSLRKSREHAQIAVCMSNQSQIAKAVFLYCSKNNMKMDWRKNHQKWIENGDLLTQADSSAYWGVSYAHLMGDVSRVYPDIAKIFTCPKAEEVDPWVDYEVNGQYTTYGFNGVSYNGERQFFDNNAYTGSASKPILSVESPADLILTQDAYESMLDGNGDTPISLTQWPNNTNEYFRHLERTVVLWFDGHATLKNKFSWSWELYRQE